MSDHFGRFTHRNKYQLKDAEIDEELGYVIGTAFLFVLLEFVPAFAIKIPWNGEHDLRCCEGATKGKCSGHIFQVNCTDSFSNHKRQCQGIILPVWNVEIGLQIAFFTVCT